MSQYLAIISEGVLSDEPFRRAYLADFRARAARAGIRGRVVFRRLEPLPQLLELAPDAGPIFTVAIVQRVVDVQLPVESTVEA